MILRGTHFILPDTLVLEEEEEENLYLNSDKTRKIVTQSKTKVNFISEYKSININ